MCLLMFAGLLIAGFYSPTLKDAAAYYGIMAAVCIFIAVLSATTVKKHLWLALWLWYVMYVCFGGDEFLLFLNETGEALAERWRS